MLDTTVDAEIEVIRKNLKIALAIRDTNASQVAQKADLSRNVLSNFIAGTSQISHENLLRVCRVLDVPVAMLSRPNSMTEANIRLYNTLKRVPDTMLDRVVSEMSREGSKDS